MLQIYVYQYRTVAETNKERKIGSSTMYSVQCTGVDQIINIILFIYLPLSLITIYLFVLLLHYYLYLFFYLCINLFVIKLEYCPNLNYSSLLYSIIDISRVFISTNFAMRYGLGSVFLKQTDPHYWLLQRKIDILVTWEIDR